jgi:hypothetical protein
METELKLIESFERDTRWFHDNMKVLRDRYKGNYVAVKDRSVIFANKSVDALIDMLKKQNIDPSFVLIEFVTEKPLKMLFRRK